MRSSPAAFSLTLLSFSNQRHKQTDWLFRTTFAHFFPTLRRKNLPFLLSYFLEKYIAVPFYVLPLFMCSQHCWLVNPFAWQKHLMMSERKHTHTMIIIDSICLVYNHFALRSPEEDSVFQSLQQRSKLQFLRRLVIMGTEEMSWDVLQ